MPLILRQHIPDKYAVRTDRLNNLLGLPCGDARIIEALRCNVRPPHAIPKRFFKCTCAINIGLRISEARVKGEIDCRNSRISGSLSSPYSSLHG